MDANTIFKSNVNTELLKNEFISNIILQLYNQKPRLNILYEEIDKHSFIRGLTLDILDHSFGFSPVAYCIVRILELDKTDISQYHLIERNCKDCRVIIDSLVDEKDYPEVKKYLKPPYNGRIIRLVHEDIIVAQAVEFLNALPNEQASISVLNYLAKSKYNISSKRRLEELLDHFHAAFNCTKDEAMEVVFSTFPNDLKSIIFDETIEIDHFAFMIASDLTAKDIDDVLDQSGFKDNHRHFFSTVMSKELGKNINKDEVETEIVKATITNGTRDVEIFIPNDHLNVNNWIESGLGSHLAFRVKSEKSIIRILDALNKNHIPIPSFMMGKPMRNEKEKATVLYCEVISEDYHFRVEFTYREPQ